MEWQTVLAALAPWRLELAGFAALAWGLAIARWWGGGARVKADRGGVVVGGDNHGSINTGQIGGTGKPGPDWVAVVSMLAGLASAVVAVLAWRLPVTPG